MTGENKQEKIGKLRELNEAMEKYKPKYGHYEVYKKINTVGGWTVMSGEQKLSTTPSTFDTLNHQR